MLDYARLEFVIKYIKNYKPAHYKVSKVTNSQVL